MGTHGAAGARSRVLSSGSRTAESTNDNSASRRWLSPHLSDWPVARRLFAVIVAALLMGLAFGGLRVAEAEDSANQTSRTQQLARLTTQLITLVNDLENERDATLLLPSAISSSGYQQSMSPWYAKSTAAIKAVQQAASGIHGLPGNIETDVSTVLSDISPSRIQQLHNTISSGQGDLTVIDAYSATITDLVTLADQTGQGVADASLAGDVQALNALANAKEQVSQQRALLNYAFTSPDDRSVKYYNTDGTEVTVASIPTVDPATEQALAVAFQQQIADVNAFYPAASPAQASDYTERVDQSAGAAATDTAEVIEDNLLNKYNNVDYFTGNNVSDAADDTGASVPGAQLIPSLQGITLLPGATLLTRGLATWDLGMDNELTAMQSTEMQIAGEIEARASQLTQAARESALTYGIITGTVLLVVLLAALAVARSLVLPLRRLRLGALDIASVQLPERVRLLAESPDDAMSTEVVPINVTSGDEIGQVARAFDRVHSEAVRLAGEQALLRSSFNAMFVNLSRRSQTLIERLARMIDTQEQNEDDPDRLNGLFSMDHLVTRMRRNSENLLLLAGHENPRKWSESVSLADAARAAISEIEQYNRITLSAAPDIYLTGQAVSDVVHLLAELIENATMYSPKDTRVQMTMQELASGGVLIEVLDKGIGVSEARLAEMNWRLDNPPTIDVSVSRHMGLFAVARLAERHRVRVRLRAAQPQGLSALVWLPESLIERTSRPGGTSSWSGQPVGARSRAGEPVALAAGARAGRENGYANGNGSRVSDDASPTWFRGGDGPGTAAGGGVSPDWDGGRSPAEIVANPAQGDPTVAGLPVRVPRANLIPGSGISGGAADRRAGSATVGSANGLGTTHGAAPLPQRSPEHARSRLAGFQRGMRRAEAQGGHGSQTPRAAEGNE